MDKDVLVTGATGAQGGAVVRHLLAAGWQVRALVRDPGTRAAHALERAGARTVTGDMGDRASLDAATRGAYGVFSVQPTAGYPGTPSDFATEDEIRLGLNVADCAAEAGVRHLVYSSVGGADRATGVRRWESKWHIERHIAQRALPATVLRPVRFMENHTDPRLGVRNGVLADVFRPETPVQLVAVDDIGAFAALAFADPDRYVGRALELAGDELTMPDIVAALGRRAGRLLTYRAVSREALVGGDPDGLAGYDFGNDRGGWRADIPMLRRLYPGLTDLDAWLGKQDTASLTALSGPWPGQPDAHAQDLK